MDGVVAGLLGACAPAEVASSNISQDSDIFPHRAAYHVRQRRYRQVPVDYRGVMLG